MCDRYSPDAFFGNSQRWPAQIHRKQHLQSLLHPENTFWGCVLTTFLSHLSTNFVVQCNTCKTSRVHLNKKVASQKEVNEFFACLTLAWIEKYRVNRFVWQVNRLNSEWRPSSSFV